MRARHCTEDGSWEQSLERLPEEERLRARRLLEESYTQGVDRGLLVLFSLGVFSMVLITRVPANRSGVLMPGSPLASTGCPRGDSAHAG